MRRVCILVLICITALPAVAYAAILGPYSGRVIDAQSGMPVEGATVFIYWVKSVPNIMGSSSEMIDLRLVYTDKDGKYRIPVVMANTGLTGSLESTIVIIYQPGYQAYLKTIWHGTPHTKPDPPFKESGNNVKLSRIPPNFDHKKHYEEIEHALWGVDEYRNAKLDFPSTEKAIMDEIEWKKMIKVNKKVIPYKRELMQRVEWEERRAREERRSR